MTKVDWRPMSEAPTEHGARVLISVRGEVFVATWDPQPYSQRPRPFWRIDWATRDHISRDRQPERWAPVPDAFKEDGA